MEEIIGMGKKLVQINTVCNNSTGKIMADIQRQADKEGYETISFVGRRKVFKDLRCEKYGSGISFWIHVAINTVFDRQGYGSCLATRRLVKRLRQEQPDIIHLHNLHGYYLNLPILFAYLANEFEGKIFWTFHDCWPFTGHCAYFSAKECDKWKKGCYCCPSKKEYPISLLLDSSKRNYCDKRKMFSSLKNLTILTPSEWMAGLIKESFFQKYPVEVVNNGIDLSVFSYRHPQEEIYEKYHIDKERKILLGVANIWDLRKGLNDFLAIAEILPEEYQIVLVGLSDRQIKKIPANIIGIKRTEKVEELVEVYSMAHVFINPSLEESFSLVTVEAMACGTPVIVLDTSAVKELVDEENGIVLNTHQVEDYLKAVKELEAKKISRDHVMQTARQYDVKKMTNRVIQLYERYEV